MKTPFPTRPQIERIGEAGGGHILLPFTNQAISRRAFEAAIRHRPGGGARR